MKDEKAHKEEKALRQEQDEIWFSTLAADDTQVYDVDRAFDRFSQRTTNKRSKRFRIPAIWNRVAVVLLIGLISWASYWQGGRQVKDNFSDIVVEAPLGSKTKLILPDGTLVWLNAGSQIVYSQGFGVNDRNLRFSGEGYFEVTSNKSLPFTIKTVDLGVTVLGTKFNFRDYPEDKEAVVDLLEGRLSLENYIKDMDLHYLDSSNKMVLNKITGELLISAMKTNQVREWTNDLLLFDEALLSDIVKELERSYNVSIRIEDDSLKSHRFYGYFDTRKQTIQEILEIMGTTGRLKYQTNKDTLSLYQ